MRIFQNCKEAYREILRDIVKFGRVVKSKTQQNVDVSQTDQWHSKEIQLYTFGVIDASDSVAQAKDPEWVLNEIMERMNTREPYLNPGENWKRRAHYWEKYMRDGKMDYSYNERMGPYVHDIVDALVKNSETRRAVLSVWDQQVDGKNIHKLQRVSCSMYYNLMIREGALDVIYHIRSCDYYEHFRNDFALADLYRTCILDALTRYEGFQDLKVGKTMMVIDSLHIYKKDMLDLGINPNTIF